MVALMEEQNHLDLADFLAIAERVLDVPAEQLQRAGRIDLAESALAAPHAHFEDVVFYPDPVDRAAILCSRIVRNHPLPDGNKRTGLLCMLELLHRDGSRLDTSDQDALGTAIEDLASGDLSEAGFILWVRARVEPGSPGPVPQGHMRAGGAQAFCRELDSIDELVERINSDGSTVISEPADMAGPLERLATKFGAVAEEAPTDELEEAFRGAESMFRETALKLREFPPEAAVTEAAQLSTNALARLQEFAPAVLEFRAKYCNDADRRA